jgi:hypothetical protein
LFAICNIPEQTELFFDYYKHGDDTTKPTGTKMARIKNKWAANSKKR